jgi:hyperosmotically inducible protein
MPKFFSYFVAFFLACVLTQAQATNLHEIEQELSDAVITTKIKAKFAKNSNLNPLKISVSTVDSVVTLSGYVKNKEAFVDALRIANATKSVKTVETEHLEIKLVNSALTDTYITAKVEAAVLKAKVLDDESIPLVGISATTTNGTVKLTGEVKSDKSIAYILKRVSAIKGVKKIISGLQVATK